MKNQKNQSKMKNNKFVLSFLVIFMFIITSGIRFVPYESTKVYTKISIYTVKSGDTLWSIVSSEISEQTDIRQTIDRIKELNHLEDQPLHVGDTLILSEDTILSN